MPYGSSAFYNNLRSQGQYWITDPIFSLNPNDIGPAVSAAINAAIVGSYSGYVVIPALPSAAQYIWATPINVDISSIGNFVGRLNIVGMNAQIRISMPGLTTSTVLQILNMPSGSVHVADLVFTGDPAVGDDCGCVLSFGGMKQSTITRCHFYGIQTSVNGYGAIRPATQHTAVRDCMFVGCGFRGTTGGTIVFNASNGAELRNTLIYDFDSLRGVAYNKGADTTWLYTESIVNLLVENTSMDENVSQSIWLNSQTTQSAIGRVVIRGTVLNQPNNVANVLVGGFGCESLLIQDTMLGQGHQLPGGLDLTNCAECTLERVKFGPAGTAGGGVHTVLSRTGNGNLRFIDCSSAYLLDTTRGAPASVTEIKGGITTQHPCSIPGLKFWVRGDMGMGINAAFEQGAGGTFAAVTPGHHLDISVDDVVAPIVIAFAGTENTVGSFISAINAAGGGYLSAANVAGQIKITSLVQSLLFSEGTILGSTSADVLTSLGVAAGAFNNPATMSTWADSSGQNDATHNLAASGSPVYARLDTNFINQPSVTCLSSNYMLSPVWTTPAPQTLTVAVVARQLTAGTATLFDDGASGSRCAIAGDATEIAVHLNAGADVVFPVTDTTKANLYIAEFSGATSSLAVSAALQLGAKNAGAHQLASVALGRISGGAGQGGWAIAECAVYGRALTYFERKSLTEYASRRYGIPMTAGALAGDTGGPLNANIVTGIQTTPVRAAALAFNEVLLIDAADVLPSAIAGLQVWLEADTGVALSGATVTSWTDQSSNAYVLTPPIASPTFSALGGPNSKPTIQFSAASTQSLLNFGITPALPTTGQTIFTVQKSNSATPSANGATVDVCQTLAILLTGTNTRAGLFGATNFIQDANNSITTNWEAFRLTCINGAQTLFINGVSIGTDTQNESNGSWLSVGYSRTYSTHWFDGSITAILVWNRVLTGPEITKVQSYLAHKYALTIAGINPATEWAPVVLSGDVAMSTSVPGQVLLTGGVTFAPFRISTTQALDGTRRNVYANTTAAIFTVTMPPTAALYDGMVIYIKDDHRQFAVHNLTVAANSGQTIQDPVALTVGATAVLSVLGAHPAFQWDATQTIWLAVRA